MHARPQRPPPGSPRRCCSGRRSRCGPCCCAPSGSWACHGAPRMHAYALSHRVFGPHGQQAHGLAACLASSRGALHFETCSHLPGACVLGAGSRNPHARTAWLPSSCRLCKKYPAVRDALIVSVLETVLRYNKAMAGIEVGRGRLAARGEAGGRGSGRDTGHPDTMTATDRPRSRQSGYARACPQPAWAQQRALTPIPRPCSLPGAARRCPACRRRRRSASATSTATSLRRPTRLWQRRRRGGQPCGRAKRAQR